MGGSPEASGCWSRAPRAGLGTSPSSLRDTPAQRSWSGPVDLVFDTRGGEVPVGERVVTIAEETPGAIYFIVEPDHEQLLELRTLVDAGELRAEVDSVFPLTEARAAFERVAGRGKRGKVVLQVGTD